MGANESAQPEDSSKLQDRDAVADEESANDVQDGERTDAKLLQKNGQISGLSEKAEDQTEEVNGPCEDGVIAEIVETNSSIVSQKEDIPETIETLTEELPPLEKADSDGKESPDADDEASTNETETEVKLNEVNDSFKKLFSSIGLKFTLKKDSVTTPEVSPKKEEGEARTPEDSKETETTIDNAEENTEQSTPEDLTDDTIKECVGDTPELVDDTLEAYIDEAPNKVVADSPVEPADDSTSQPVMTDLTFVEFLNETTKEQTTETIESKEEVTPEEVAQAEGESPATPVPVVEEMSPFKRFFLTGKIHKQVKQEPKKQPKEEPKEEVMEEHKEEPKTEPKEEVNEEPKEEVNEEPKDEVKEEVTPTEETDTPAPTIADVEEEIVSPIKKFFTTGIFAGLKKKKNILGEETPKGETVEKEQELQSIEKLEDVNTPEEAGLEQEQTKEEISPDVETIPVIEGKQNENEVQLEIAASTSEIVTDSLTAETSNVPELMSNVPKTSDNREDVLEEQPATEGLQTIISNEAELLSFQEEAKSQGSSVQDILEEQSPSWGCVTVITNEAETNEAKLISSQEKAKSQESLEEQFHPWGFITVTAEVPEEESAPEVLMTVTSNEAETNKAELLNSQERAKSQGSPVQGILEEQSPSLGFHTVISNEAELLSSQEKAKIQGSPLRKLLYGAGLNKLSRKRRGRKSDELTGSVEHVAEDLLSSTESEEYQRGERPDSPPKQLAAEQVNMSAPLGSSHESDGDVTSDGERKKDGTWTSFKKLMTPTRRPKRSSESEDELALVGSHEEPKQSEGEQVLERFTEEPKKKVEISVSWEALLCGSAKRRGRKTSDSEEEAPMNEGETLSEPANTAESPLDSSQEGGYEHLTSSPEQAVSPLGSEGGSTWKSLKKLVTSNRKAKTEEVSKANSPEQMPSDSESTKEESSFSLKKLIPGRKKRKHGGKQEPISSDEADKGVGSDDEEDSETPAVVPMSEFDAEELGEKHIISTEAVIETLLHITEETQPDVSRLVTESAIPKDTLPTETEKAQAKDTVEQLAPSTSPTATEDFEDLTEFISKHQQLSDIPEEGLIEETIATQVSTAEEATRDDTIAEDLIELTSEAVTAPEPLDDESTEMVSAVSQLTDESPKTSGNTTPVPSEYELKETEVLLHEVVENISRTPTLSSVITKDPHLEEVAVSVSPQILQTPKETETTVLIAHEKSDAVAICTGEESQQIDAVDEWPVTHVVECSLEVSEVVPTELAPEETEESGAAGITTDEVHKAEDESIPIMHIQIEKDQQIELVNELEEARPVFVATINSEESVAQVEGKAIAEDSPQPDTESLEVSVADKLIFTQPLTEVTPEVEEKEELMDVSEDSADMENAPVAETTTCEVQDVTAAMPDVLKLEPSDVLESLIGIVAPAVESPEKMDPVGALRPLVGSSMVQTLKVGDMVVMKNVPSAQFVDGHAIQVQVTDAELKSAEETVEKVLEVSSTDVNDHEILVQQVDAEIKSAEANVETTLELGSTDDHEITVQVADAELKSALVIIDNVLEVGLTDVTDHEIQVQEMYVEIESAEAIVDAAFEVVLTEVKGHEIQVQVTDANAEMGSGEAILEAALEVVSSTDVKEVINICNKMEDEGEGENAIKEIEEDVFEEASSIITHEILQHVQQNSSEDDPNVVPQSSEKAEVELTSEAEVSKSPEGTPVVAVTDAQGCPGVAAQVRKKINLFENYSELNTQANAHEPSDKETEPSIALEVDTVCEDRTTPETFAESTFEVDKVPDDIVTNTFAESCLQSNVQEVHGTEAEFIIASEVDSDSTSGHEKELVGMVVQSAKESVESFEKRLSIESHVHIHLHIEPRDAGVVSAGLDSPPLAIWPPPSTTEVNTDSFLKESIESASTTAKSAVNTDCVPTESMESTQVCEVGQIEQTNDTAPPAALHTPPAPLHTPPAPLHTTPAPLHTPPAPLHTPPAPLHTTPAPLHMTPAPLHTTPAPLHTTPAPLHTTPAPLDSTPAPLHTTPAPLHTTPAPLHSTPAPLHSTPAPLDSTPAPLHSTPAPLHTTPAPLHSPNELVVCTPNPEAEQVTMNAVESIPHIEDEIDQDVWLDAEEDFGTVKSHVLEVLSNKMDGGVEETLQVSEEVFDIALEPQSVLSISETK